MFELLDLYNKYKRSKSEPAQLCAQIKSWGGHVLEVRSIARLSKSPFSNLRVLPLLYEIRAQHDHQKGYWYVRTSSDGAAPDWMWYDEYGIESVPGNDVDARLTIEVNPVSWTADWILVGVALIIVVIIVVVIVNYQ